MNYKGLIENGIKLARKGKFIEAENSFKKAIEKDSSLADSYINLANIYNSADKYVQKVVGSTGIQ